MRRPWVPAAALVIATVLLAAACDDEGDELSKTTPLADGATTSTASPALASAVSDAPAAGTCVDVEGDFADVTMSSDAPTPRCLRVMRSQRLRVKNAVDRAVEITLAGTKMTLAPGERRVFGRDFGTYLAPGVHVVHSTAYGRGGAELWLR